MDDLVETGLADTLVVDKLSVAIIEAAGAGAGGSAGLAESGTLLTDGGSRIIVSGQALAVVVGISGGVIRAGITDSADRAGETLVRASGTESTVLVVSRIALADGSVD